MDLFEYARQAGEQAGEPAGEDPAAMSLEGYRELCERIRHLNELYYARAQPEVSDAEYDALYRKLELVEDAHPEWVTPESPTQRVGNDLTEGFAKVRHPEPMQSIDDIFEHKPEAGETDVELVAFYRGLCEAMHEEAPAVVVEPKIDGCAVTLMYRRGRLRYAATRGDGMTGDDITANVRTIAAIPTRLPEGAPELLEVRGEIFMRAEDFDRLNRARDEEGLPAFANPRNATAGTIKLLDAQEVARRPLSFLAHGLGQYQGERLHTSTDFEALLHRMGIPCNEPMLRVRGTEPLREAVRRISVLRRELGFATDGAVIKLDDFAAREALGSTARAPRWAAAFKFLPEQKPTRLRAITVQVGRTGVLTPVAELDPVPLSGTIVSRATLHNQDEIERKDIRIGDTLLMEKSGEIIPAVVKVLTQYRPEGSRPYSLYEAVGGVCPSCGAPIAQEEGQVAWRCTNFACPAQAVMRTAYFCRRENLDVEALGETVAEALVRRGLIHSPLDLFDLTLEQLADLNLGTDEEARRFGEKNARRVLAGLERARSLPLSRWLSALGIPGVGTVTAKLISACHHSLADVAHSPLLALLLRLQRRIAELQQINPRSARNLPHSAAARKAASAEQRARMEEENRARREGLTQRARELEEDIVREAADLPAAQGFRVSKGSEKGFSLTLENPIGHVATLFTYRYFSSAAGEAVLARLARHGLNPVSDNETSGAETGPLAGKSVAITGTLSRPRAVFAHLIEKAGGKVASSVTRKTDYLLAGEGGGSKREKAAGLGVALLSEEDFLRLIGDAPEGEGTENQDTEKKGAEGEGAEGQGDADKGVAAAAAPSEASGEGAPAADSSRGASDSAAPARPNALRETAATPQPAASPNSRDTGGDIDTPDLFGAVSSDQKGGPA